MFCDLENVEMLTSIALTEKKSKRLSGEFDTAFNVSDRTKAIISANNYSAKEKTKHFHKIFDKLISSRKCLKDVSDHS